MPKKPAAKKPERKQKAAKKIEAEPMNPRAKKELAAIFCLLGALVSILAFMDMAGPAGTAIDTGLSAVFGWSKFLAPLVMLGYAGRVFFPEKFVVKTPVTVGIILFFVSVDAFSNVARWRDLDAMLFPAHLAGAGGYVGLILGYPLMKFTGPWASMVILAGIVAVSLLLSFDVTVHDLMGKIFSLRKPPVLPNAVRVGDESSTATSHDVDAPTFSRKEVGESLPERPLSAEEVEARAMTASVKRKRAKMAAIPFDLLETRNSKPNSGDVHGKMHVIQKTLENFGIPVEMGEVCVGPTVTQFSLKPADGVKLNKITSLSNDLALSLAAHPIRIEAPIPGKSLVGIEVPNQAVAMVSMREVLESGEFTARKSNLTICLGKDVAGKPWIADLSKMPHILVAGATGSGKTVCLNTIILSLLFQNGPDDLKLMLIDPKRVELPVYNGIPHLVTPAITEVPKIINALKWAITEMDRRFDMLSKAGKRDITSYNEANPDEKMPFLIIVIDELADLMVASAAEVEAAIIRLAQMARAVGIHLVVATQRPSVDVITGLIKANITARVAFSVASSTDSRTILDQPGAERLVGRGDSLFVSADLSSPKRIQCCYVGDSEIRKVVDFLVEGLEEPVSYVEGITEKKGLGASGSDFGYNDDGDDELLEEARDVVVKAGKASASYLQRRLKVGYARAARLLDLLEERGIIGPGEGAKPRQILVTPVMDEDGAHFSEDRFDDKGI